MAPLLAKPLRKHGACLSCRQRKLKCDGIKPICSVCTRDSRDCQYVERQQAKSKTSALEERLENLQRQLCSLSQQRTSPDLHPGSTMNTTSGPNGYYGQAVYTQDIGQTSQPSTQSISPMAFASGNDFSQLLNPAPASQPSPKYATANALQQPTMTSEPMPMGNAFGSMLQTPELEMNHSGREDSSGSSSSMQSTPATYLNSSTSSLSLGGKGSQGLDDFFNITGSLELRNNNGLPDLLTFTELASVYFEKVEPLYVHFPHRNRFLVKAFGRLLSPQIPIPTGERSLILAICAHGAARSEKHAHLAKAHADMAYSTIAQFWRGMVDGTLLSNNLCDLGVAREQEDLLPLIQANILMSLYGSAVCMYNTSWLHIGMAEHLAQLCGLDRIDGQSQDCIYWGQMKSSPNPPCLPSSKDWIEEEERRRTFWGLWCCARFLGGGMTHASNLPFNGMPHRLPCDEKSWQEEWPERPSGDANGPNLAALQIETVNIVFHVGAFVRALNKRAQPADEVSLPDFGLSQRLHPSMPADAKPTDVFAELDRAITRQKLKVPQHYDLAGNYFIIGALYATQITLYGCVACSIRRTQFAGAAEKAVYTLPTPEEAQRRLRQATKAIVGLISPLSDFDDLHSMGQFMPMPFAIAVDCISRSLRVNYDASLADDMSTIRMWLSKLGTTWPKAASVLAKMDQLATAKPGHGFGGTTLEGKPCSSEMQLLPREAMAPPQTEASAPVHSAWSASSASSGSPRKFSFVESSPGSNVQNSPMTSFLESQMMTSEVQPNESMISQPETPRSVPEDSFKTMGGIWQNFDLHTGLTPAGVGSTPLYAGQGV